jgi:hypothetical protein
LEKANGRGLGEQRTTLKIDVPVDNNLTAKSVAKSTMKQFEFVIIVSLWQTG